MTIAVHPTPPLRAPAALLERWRTVPVAVAVDLDADLVQIDPAIRPLRPAGAQPALFGRAVTALCAPPDFGAVLHAVALIAPGDVLVIAAGGHASHAMIGEILGGQVRRQGGVGVICEGAVRDAGALASLEGLSAYARSVTPRGPLSRGLGAVNVQIAVGGRMVRPGDLVIGDDDGLAVLPDTFISSRIDEAEAKVAQEAAWIRALRDGRGFAELMGLGGAGDAPNGLS